MPIILILSIALFPLSFVFSHTALLPWIQELVQEDDRDQLIAVSEFVNTDFLFYVNFPSVRYRNDVNTITTYAPYDENLLWDENRLDISSYNDGTEVKLELIRGFCISAEGDTIETVQDWQFAELNLDYFELLTITLSTYNIIEGLVHITSNNPISVVHSTLGPCGNADGEDYEHNVAHDSDDDVWSFYGDRLFTRVNGDMWIGAYKNTEVNITDLSDRDDSTRFHLAAEEGWFSLRNQDFERFGFEDDLVSIETSSPVTIIAGYQDNDVYTQVYGRGGVDFMFPCFGFVTVVAPHGGHVDIDDLEGGEGSIEKDMKSGEMLTRDFRVHNYYYRFPESNWCHITASRPIYVYTFCQDPDYVRDGTPDARGQDRICNYKTWVDLPVVGDLGLSQVISPIHHKYDFPIHGRGYITATSLQINNTVALIIFKSGNVTLDKYESKTWTINENIDLNGDGERDHLNLTSSNFSNSVFRVKIRADADILVNVHYSYDYSYDSQVIDIIPGLTPPAPLPGRWTLIELAATFIIIGDIAIVVAGGSSVFSFLIPSFSPSKFIKKVLRKRQR